MDVGIRLMRLIMRRLLVLRRDQHAPETLTQKYAQKGREEPLHVNVSQRFSKCGELLNAHCSMLIAQC